MGVRWPAASGFKLVLEKGIHGIITSYGTNRLVECTEKCRGSILGIGGSATKKNRQGHQAQPGLGAQFPGQRGIYAGMSEKNHRKEAIPLIFQRSTGTAGNKECITAMVILQGHWAPAAICRRSSKSCGCTSRSPC